MRFTHVDFVDTNVLLYAVSDAQQERPKAERAREILARTDIGLSVQVLQEFYVQATRANRSAPLSHDQARGLVQSFQRFPVQTIDPAIVTAAMDLRAESDISYWDAAIIESARRLGCDRVLSEDLDHGQDYNGIVLENPFL